MRKQLLALVRALVLVPGSILGLGGPFVCLGASPARAADEEPEYGTDAYYARDGVYLVAQGTNNVGTFRGNPESAVSVSTDHSFGAAGQFGYRFHPNWAGELQLDWVAGFDGEIGGEDEKISQGSLTAGVKFYPTDGRFQPFGLLGLGAGLAELRNEPGADLSETQIDMVLRFGVGIDYYLTEEVGLSFNTNYVWPTGVNSKVNDLDYFSFAWGVLIRFGAQ